MNQTRKFFLVLNKIYMAVHDDIQFNARALNFCCFMISEAMEFSEIMLSITLILGPCQSDTVLHISNSSNALWGRRRLSGYQSCLTFPTGTAQTQSKHHSMRGWKGMNTPCVPFCGWEMDFWEIKPRTVLLECPLSPMFKLVVYWW